MPACSNPASTSAPLTFTTTTTTTNPLHTLQYHQINWKYYILIIVNFYPI
jgi:hypothetical protein